MGDGCSWIVRTKHKVLNGMISSHKVGFNSTHERPIVVHNEQKVAHQAKLNPTLDTV